MSNCPNCDKKIDPSWKVCPYCGQTLSDSNQEVSDTVSIRSNIEQKGTDNSEQKVADSVIQRSQIRQDSTDSKEQNISDSVAVRSEINQQSSAEVDGGVVSTDHIQDTFDELRDVLSSTQGIQDSVINRSKIKQIQDITAEFQVKGIEWLVCDNNVCRETLSLPESQKNMANFDSVILTCPKCGTETPFNKAVENAHEILSSMKNSFGDIVAQLESGDVKDGRIRSYVFQKDVVDYMASKFINICHTIQPVVSTPYSFNHCTGNKSIEYGLDLPEYIEMIMSDSKLPNNPYVTELAGGEEDEREAYKQSLKLRAVAYLIWGFDNLYHLCKDVDSNDIEYPESANKLDEIATYFDASRKTCIEGSEKYPIEKFFDDLSEFSHSMSLFVTAQKLYTEYKFSPNMFENSKSKLNQLTDDDAFILDRTKHSTVFSNPGKRTLRKSVENKLRDSAEENSSIIDSWYSHISGIPNHVSDIAERYSSLMRDYIRSRKIVSYMRVGQASVITFGILFTLFYFAEVDLSAFCVMFVILGIIFLLMTGLASKNQKKCSQIRDDFNNIRHNEAENVKKDVDVRSFHSDSVVRQLTSPLEEHESFWDSDISRLTWVFGGEALYSQLNQLRIEPPPMETVRDS